MNKQINKNGTKEFLKSYLKLYFFKFVIFASYHEFNIKESIVHGMWRSFGNKFNYISFCACVFIIDIIKSNPDAYIYYLISYL